MNFITEFFKTESFMTANSGLKNRTIKKAAQGFFKMIIDDFGRKSPRNCIKDPGLCDHIQLLIDNRQTFPLR